MGDIMKKGFTLAEVLITLGIVGVIAAITIPSLITEYKAMVLETQFKKAYSIISHAYKMAQADDETYLTRNSSLYPKLPSPNVFKKYFKNVKEVITKQVNCQNKLRNLGYKDLSGQNPNSQFLWFVDDGYMMLEDGTVYFWENANNNTQSYLSVDINGYKKGPNKWGQDLFTFALSYDGFIGVGKSSGYQCQLKKNTTYNGLGCSYWALNDKNYFRKLLKNQPVK